MKKRGGASYGITGPGISYAKGDRVSGTPSVVGRSVDAWGCEFEVREPGVIGEVKRPLFADEYGARTARFVRAAN